jgi:hypothetical protein
MKEKIIEIMFTYSGYEEKHYTKKVLREEEYNIVAEGIVKLLAAPDVSNQRELLLADFYDFLLPFGQFPNLKDMRIKQFLSKQ